MVSAKVITVTGTNGKGSTISMIESLLLCENKTVGVFINPVVTTVYEMFRVNGESVNKDKFNAASFYVSTVLKVDPQDYQFRLLSIALKLFENCEYIILETFAGGKDDVANTVDADAVIITNIANDHIPRLGKDFEELALNKAHLFRENSFAIVGREAPQRSIRDYANKVGAKISVEGVHFYTPEYNAKIHDSNIALAVETCRVFGITTNVDETLNSVRGVGYFDTYDWNGVTVITDSCHNEHGVRYFVNKIKKCVKLRKEVYTISPFAESKTSSFNGMINALNEVTTQWLSPKMKKKTLLRPQEMAKLVPTLQFKSLDECMEYVKQVAKEGDVVIACGSLPIPYEIKDILTKEL